MTAREANLLADEEQLLEKISKGDALAFSKVFHAYQKKIYSSAQRLLHDDLLAEEVVQETMLKLWVMGESLTSIQNLEGYLLKISRNKALDLLRRKELQRKAEKDLGTLWTETHQETEELILLNETKKILENGINALPPQQKMVYQICQQEGLSYEQAAEQLNLSVETIRSYMRIAQKSVRAYVLNHSDVAVLLILLKLL